MRTEDEPRDMQDCPHPGQSTADAEAPEKGDTLSAGFVRSNRSFAQRMAEAGYVTGRRYDAVKNAFLSFRTAGRKAKIVHTRISRSGESFRLGRKPLAKLCLIGGYLRLYLALDPTQYNKGKYHQKDCSDVQRYARYPFMIKLSSDRQVRYAQELIGQLLTDSGMIRNPDYVPADLAGVFRKAARPTAASGERSEQSPLYAGRASAGTPLPQGIAEGSGGTVPLSGAGRTDESDKSDETDEPDHADETVPENVTEETDSAGTAPVHYNADDVDGWNGCNENAGPDRMARSPGTVNKTECEAELIYGDGGEGKTEQARTDRPGVSDEGADVSDTEGLTCVEADDPRPVAVRLPRRGIIVDRAGCVIGKLRRRTWFDTDGTELGTFEKADPELVYFCTGGCRVGYVDHNRNILSSDGRYLGTIRTRTPQVLLCALLVAVFTLISCGVCLAVLTHSSSPYAPVLFVASEDGVYWQDSEQLPVFANDLFGDSRIAPGMSGTYRFTFENRNADALQYTLAFSEENLHEIGLVYRLRRDGAYIAGRDSYVGAEQLSVEGLTIEARSSTVFELEWYWADNDPVDTQAGEDGAVYTLNLGLEAYVSEQR